MATTVHTPKNFNPENYEIVDYADNSFNDDEMFDMSLYHNMIARLMDTYFPNDKQEVLFRCCHCHHKVRYIAIAYHKVSDTYCVFGSDCVEYLGFADFDSYKIEQLKKRAIANRASMKIYLSAVAFLKDNNLEYLTEEIKKESHAKNSFVKDVWSNLWAYGSLSEKQVKYLLSAIDKDNEIKPVVPVSNFIGTEKEKIVRDVTLTFKTGYETMYGYTNLLSFTDDQGNVLVWKTKDYSYDTFVKGNKMKIQATVKAHEIYNNVKQTIILRVKAI